jgi:ectoine hydroxylase-related dioxygenase (phytanoyl-CoA dioxygenase family)
MYGSTVCCEHEIDSQWVSSNYRAGDVLVFTLHTFHGGIVNRSKNPPRLRLSTDLRFYPSMQTMDPRYCLPRRAPRENQFKGERRTMAEARREWGLENRCQSKL